MAAVSATEGGWDRGGVGRDLSGENLERFVHGGAVDTRENLVGEAGVFDIGDAGRHRGHIGMNNH